MVDSLQKLNPDIRILGADAGLNLLLQVPNKMSENQLVHSALSVGVKVYKYSSYYFNPNDLPEQPTLLLGYTRISEEDIIASCKLFKQAWF